MENIRSSSLVLFNQTKNSMRSSQKDISKLSYQITSGNKSQDYAGLPDTMPIESYLKTKNIQSSLTQRGEINNLLSKKLSEMENSIMSLTEVVQEGLNLGYKAKDPVIGPILNSDALAKQGLEKIKNLLNNQFNGQYLFSGSKVSTSPSGDFVNTSNIVSGNITANYYQGDDDINKARISEESTIEYGITANDPAMQKLIGAFHYIIEGKTTNNPAKYVQAMDLFNEAKVDINNLVAKLGNNSKIVENQIDMDNSLSIRMRELLQSVDEVDVTEAMGELVNSQVQLQAAYMLLVRATSITLADYLH